MGILSDKELKEIRKDLSLSFQTSMFLYPIYKKGEFQILHDNLRRMVYFCKGISLDECYKKMTESEFRKEKESFIKDG